MTNSYTSSELLERARELSMLGECMEAVQRDSCGRVLLIGGEAGVGKTALLRRFRDDCPARFRCAQPAPMLISRGWPSVVWLTWGVVRSLSSRMRHSALEFRKQPPWSWAC